MSFFEPFEPGQTNARGPFRGGVRIATLADADAVAALASERHGEPLEVSQAGARKELTSDTYGTKGTLFVAVEQEVVLAFARARWVTMEQVEAALRPPDGWYLGGVIVAPDHRRRGIGRALTAARLTWLRARGDEAFYLTNRANRVSIALHEEFGFEEHMAHFRHPVAGLEPGEGMLYRVAL